MRENQNYDYLFRISEKSINSLIYEIGIARGGKRLALEEIVGSCDASQAEQVILFLQYYELLQTDCYELSQDGKKLFELLFVFLDIKSANEYIANLLLQHPIVNLIVQSFYGRGKIRIEQLRVLMNYHNVGTRELLYTDVVSLLVMLNKYGIVVYDKKNKVFCVRMVGEHFEPISQYYILPDTPYSNVYNMRKIIRACKGDVYWIDKHFRKEGFEILIDGLASEGVKSVTIISGTDNMSLSAKTEYFNLRMELSKRQIMLNWRIISNNLFKWHDRWLVADNQCYNIPPVLAIIRGQRAEMLLTKEHLDVTPFMSESVLVS